MRTTSNQPSEALSTTIFLFKELLMLQTQFYCSHFHIFILGFCGQGWIRTTELRRGQIYSLLPLATWLLAQKQYEKELRSTVFNFVIRTFLRITFFEPLVGVEPTTY